MPNHNTTLHTGYRTRLILVQTLSVILASAICVRCSGLIDIPLPVITALSLTVLATCIEKQITLCLPLASLVTYYGLTLIMHPEPELPLRASRFAAFTIGMLIFSPLLTSPWLNLAREQIGKMMFWILAIMVAASFAIWTYCMATGRQMSDTTFFYYGFKGIFDKGMTLSPIAGFISVITLQKALATNKPTHAAYWTIATVISIITCVAAGSRIATVAMIAAITIETLLMRDCLKKHLAGIRSRILATAAILSLAALSPMALQVIVHKNSIGNSHDSLIYSRQEIWATRIKEISSSPFIGIGYANEYPRPSWKNEPGKLTYLEPGSSWLSLLSYGGIIGTALFCWFMSATAKNIYRTRHSRLTPLTISLLTFFLVDGITEGWLLFAGALMFPLFWLICSIPFNKYMQ